MEPASGRERAVFYIVIFAVLLIVANRRAGHIEQHQNDTQDGSSTP